MIRGVIVMNDQGKPRLLKFYDYQPVEKQQELIRSIYGVLCSRPENVSNFIQVDSIVGSDARLVYKTFATLYFVFIFDKSENELAILDLMQVFVEILDKCFNNACELDIVFNFNKVHTILDEIICGGQVLETSSTEVVKAVEEISKCSLSHTLLSVHSNKCSIDATISFMQVGKGLKLNHAYPKIHSWLARSIVHISLVGEAR